MPDPKPGFSFPGPVPREALDYFRAKDLRPGFDYRDVWGQEHAHAFTVAKAIQLDILDDLREAVEEALAEGKPFRQFSKDLTPTLHKKGWWGKTEQLDPKAGELRTVQLGSPRRLRTIYRSNLRAARAAGQWQRIRLTKDTHPYLLYELGPSERHRPQHVAWAGTLLPADDPWWQTHFTPNGWGCKCRVRQVSKREAARRGGVTERPRYDPVEWANKRTGEVQTVDRGLDPAWAGNSGVDRARVLQDSLAEKIEAADENLARAAVRQVVESPLLEHHLERGSPGERKGDLPIAFLPLKWSQALGVSTRLARLPARISKKERKKHKEIQPEDYRVRLPEMIDRSNALLVLRQTRLRRGKVTPDRDLVVYSSTHKLVLRNPGLLKQKDEESPLSIRKNYRVDLTTFFAPDDWARDVRYALESEGVEVIQDLRGK